MKKNKGKNKFQYSRYERAMEFISKIELPLNVSRTNYITNCLNDNIITFDDIPDDILENYKLNVDFREDLNTVAIAIKKFKSLNLEYDVTKSIKWNTSNFIENYRNCFGKIKLPILYIKKSIKYSFFRARKLYDIVDFDNIDEFSYPKNNCILGRANLPTRPVFYCSLSPITAIDEIKKPVISGGFASYVVSKWKMKDSNEAISIVPTYTKETERSFNRMIKEANIKSTEKQKEYLKFVGEQLLSENYSKSALLSYHIIYQKDMDAILYPSLIDNRSPNMAISPELIDNGIIVMDKVYIVTLFRDKKITLNKVGIFNENKVEWFSAKDLQENNKYLQEFNNDFGI